MRDLALTVVAARHCSTSRTYLTYLRQAGLRPKKVILVDFVWNDDRFSRLRKWLGRDLAWRLIRRGRMPWPPQSPRFEALCALVQRDVPLPIDYFASFDYAAHAVAVEGYVASDYEDPGLHALLRRQSDRVFLYTDGGRVPAALLDDPNLAFLHIHPGVVPYVRGSDGLLWSMLLRGRPGASCFYMDAGIDTGRLIRTREFERPRFPGLAAALDEDFAAAYRALLYAYDPHLRAQLFTDVMRDSGTGDLSLLQATAQPAEGAMSFTGMHPRLQARVMRKLDP